MGSCLVEPGLNFEPCAVLMWLQTCVSVGPTLVKCAFKTSLKCFVVPLLVMS